MASRLAWFLYCTFMLVASMMLFTHQSDTINGFLIGMSVLLVADAAWGLPE